MMRKKGYPKIPKNLKNKLKLKWEIKKRRLKKRNKWC